MSSGRRKRRSKVRRVINFLRRIVAFFFSHVGLCAIVTGFGLLGAVTFRAVEAPHERKIQNNVTMSRHHAVRSAWNVSVRINRLNKDIWKQTVYKEIKDFQRVLLFASKAGYDGKELGLAAQWTFTGAFLYSLTVITTIGYGNTSCKTYLGKTLTIMYAIIGIPLMLLFLTNIGDILAKTFRFLYARALQLKLQLVLWHRRRKAARLRRANSLVSRITRSSGRSAGSAERNRVDHHGRYADDNYLFGGAAGGSGSAGGADFEDLLSAQAQLEQLEIKQNMEERLRRVTVPLSLVLFSMFTYLMIGTVMFHYWEKEWELLDAFYFCFISLTTIGFGDLFPGASVGEDADATERLIITSIYLVFGMAMIAMCINLAQEEVVNKVSRIAAKIGVIKDDDDDFD